MENKNMTFEYIQSKHLILFGVELRGNFSAIHVILVRRIESKEILCLIQTIKMLWLRK